MEPLIHEWRAYRGIVRLPMWLQHRKVRHSQHFVDPITRYHTQNIERKWGELKAVFRKKKGIHDKQLNSHIAEFYGVNDSDKLCTYFIIFGLMFPSSIHATDVIKFYFVNLLMLL